jgi:hypothetical protein
MGRSPASSAAWYLFVDEKIRFPEYWRRSEWPITHTLLDADIP